MEISIFKEIDSQRQLTKLIFGNEIVEKISKIFGDY
jgi:hypothetical protein